MIENTTYNDMKNYVNQSFPKKNFEWTLVNIILILKTTTLTATLSNLVLIIVINRKTMAASNDK